MTWYEKLILWAIILGFFTLIGYLGDLEVRRDYRLGRTRIERLPIQSDEGSDLFDAFDFYGP